MPITLKYFSMRRYFAAIGEKDKVGNGWPLAFCSGNSMSDFKDWSIETVGLKGDEVPGVCNDSKTFSELVAGLLNAYFNELETKDLTEEKLIRMGKPLVELRIPHLLNPELPF
jgi:hypothetical protein